MMATADQQMAPYDAIADARVARALDIAFGRIPFTVTRLLIHGAQVHGKQYRPFVLAVCTDQSMGPPRTTRP